MFLDVHYLCILTQQKTLLFIDNYYDLDNHGKFVWLPDPNDPKVQRGYFVCNDDGNVVSEERNLTDAYEKLDDLNEEGWKYE